MNPQGLSMRTVPVTVHTLVKLADDLGDFENLIHKNGRRIRKWFIIEP